MELEYRRLGRPDQALLPADFVSIIVLHMDHLSSLSLLHALQWEIIANDYINVIFIKINQKKASFLFYTFQKSKKKKKIKQTKQSSIDSVKKSVLNIFIKTQSGKNSKKGQTKKNSLKTRYRNSGSGNIFKMCVCEGVCV